MDTERRNWDVVVVGSANTDLVGVAAELPEPGKRVEGDVFQIGVGGKGVNQAVAAARLGARVALVACLGSDERGEAVLAALAVESVDPRWVTRDPQAPTGVAFMQMDRVGRDQTIVLQGANLRLLTHHVRSADEALRSTRTVLVQLEIPIDAAQEAARLGHEAGARVILDPAPGLPLPPDIYPFLDIVRSNAQEAERLTGIPVHDRDSARRAAARILSHGARAASVQAGEGGDLLLGPDGEVWLPHCPVQTIDANGAGDAFTAALAVSLLEGRSWQGAGRFASAAAALATTRLGAMAGLPRRREVLDLLARSGHPGSAAGA